MLKELRWEKILACLDDQQLVLVNDLIKQLQLLPTTKLNQKCVFIWMLVHQPYH
ncbi:hypothetical protein [Spiroplasma kunkelii]|uniref:hypothetical protein n=1 Tax=Spiroplasma kunkelii TaxID=47834 RepID=UPI0003218FAD|nr:hypothetical protein [Spiroplasma kunkelii]